jgi:hypothetical protein
VATLPTHLEDILLRQPVWRGGALAQAVSLAVPTGFADLDRELPGGGWPGGALTELLCAEEGIGQVQLVLPALVLLTAAGQRVAWIAPPYLPYAPALAAAGVDLSCIAVVRSASRRDTLWAAEQALRAQACKAVLIWLRGVRYAELRRLALAAENGAAICLVFRPAEEAKQPTPACLRLALTPDGGKVSARIVKRRGAPAAKPLRISVERSVHALGGAPFPASPDRSAVARSCVS